MSANPMPAAEVDVSADLVRRLLADQHPDLARLPVTFLANGWDNVMFRVGDELIARMPRRELGAKILVHEQRWLPLLARALPLQIPYPERTGLPALGYPWPWSTVPHIPGEPAADTDTLDPADAAAGLHPANVLSRDGRISGVIDFGDITSGDPAVDLAVAWMLLPVRWHAAFRDAYAAGGAAVGVALWTRGGGWALYLALVFLAYSADNPQLLRVGRRTLPAVLG